MLLNLFLSSLPPLYSRVQLKIADSAKNLVCHKVSKLTNLPGFLAYFFPMPRGKQLDVIEKTKFFKWFG
jgi:hypothetical protein